ncbi:hypothetical protein BDW72DRAFT_199706 [Aspergillus terricola var. indicus]
MLQHLITAAGLNVQTYLASITISLQIGSAFLATLIAWRIWKFTILPLFRPDDPVELPYWIPYFGHAGAYLKDSHGLMKKAIKRFGTMEPFSLTIAGDRYYVITSPADTRPFFANASALTIDGFLDRSLIAFGCAPGRLDKMWQLNAPSRLNPKGKSLVNLTEDLFKQDLVPGLPFDVIVERYQKALDGLLSWDRLVGVHPSLVGTGPGGRTEPISLYDLCTDIVVNANLRVFFAPALLAIDSNMAVEIRTFTDGLWKLFDRSRFADITDVAKLRHQYISVFRNYLQLPPQSRNSEMRVIRNLVEVYSEMGIHEDDQAAVLFMIWWATSANAYRAAFWVLAYILHDPQLREIVRQETASAVGRDGKLNWSYLTKECPRLFSIYYEVLRLTKRDLIFRKVVRDTIVAGKQLRRGGIAVIPTCQLHDNPETYGPDAASFNPDRFLQSKNLDNTNKALLAFGGGRHYCPGHQVAALEIIGFAAVMINQFNIKVAWPDPFPQRDDSLITLGISRPVPGDDLYVTLASDSRGL